MIDREVRAALVAAACVLPGIASGQAPAGSEPKLIREVEANGRHVLVELYTSQGCNYCPTAERLLAEMRRKGYGPDRVVALAFHVDYFNTPWADPFSSQAYSSRQWAYHEAFKKKDPKTPDLYFTPMVMVNGRYPMSGYHSDGIAPVWPHLKARLDRALREIRERREVGMTLTLEAAPGSDEHRELSVSVRPQTPRAVGKELLLCVAVAEGPLSTAVPSGENAGETLVEDHIVRDFRSERLTPRRDGPAEARFSIDLKPGQDPSRCELVVFLQDERTGALALVTAMPWSEPVVGGR
ncbi:DUF1223 domain-containing protein [Tautonia sociabilis]|uniref:DUF1223 domain-containing protein n=1 Tax=Tautonia sociabilis TaxID=2080755 RepID=A0A432MH50_9BACT|nr:DUF1223 domain-containing protein [Tautonia sociabilis]RUL86308.1 DUF1223 domain-containing protein [Tautonia sociabilis]